MKALTSRLAALERRLSCRANGVGCAIALQGDETLEAACQRLGLRDGGGRIVLGETLAPDRWDSIAREQQAKLVR